MAGGTCTADYDYTLPRDRIAQHPPARREDSRLLVVDRSTGGIEHRRFADIAELVPAGDALVVNNSRVIRARLLGRREGGGAAELLLLQPRDDGLWEALLKPGNRLRVGRRIQIAPDTYAEVAREADDGAALVRFVSPLNVDDILAQYGHVPLPPYIARTDEPIDAERYQTVYALEPGSVAAPTAGLHFTPELLARLSDRGVGRVDLTLHVGAGTFKPVQSDDPSEHRMHVERYTLPPAAAAALNATRQRGAHIWAVGTTSLRVLETALDAAGRFVPGEGTTDVFIRPPHAVRGADRLITNFHLPRSTLLMLVAAFAGYELTREVYEVAIASGYRFYSYGDAMCIL